jgi:hypothetical protein
MEKPRVGRRSAVTLHERSEPINREAVNVPNPRSLGMTGKLRDSLLSAADVHMIVARARVWAAG